MFDALLIKLKIFSTKKVKGWTIDFFHYNRLARRKGIKICPTFFTFFLLESTLWKARLFRCGIGGTLL